MISTLLLAAIMLNLTVMPVMAKPNTITVVVKDVDHKPVNNAHVYIYVTGPDGSTSTDLYEGTRGKYVFTFDDGKDYATYYVMVNGQYAVPSAYLSNQDSARVRYVLP